MTLTVNYAGHPILITNKFDFDIEIVDPCINNAILTPNAQNNPSVYRYSSPGA